MRKIILTVIMLFIGIGIARAEKIYLLNGDIVDGKIVGRGPMSTMVRVDGKMRRIENTNIDRIEKDPPLVEPEVVAELDMSSGQEAVLPEQQPLPSADVQKAVAVTTTVDTVSEVIYNGPEVADEVSMEKTANPDMSKFDGMTTQQLVLKLLKSNGMQENLQQNMVAILSKLTPEQRAQVEPAMKLDEILEALVPVYEKNFTVKELKELILFYESDLGEKLIQVMPKISEEVVKATVTYFSQKFKTQ